MKFYKFFKCLFLIIVVRTTLLLELAPKYLLQSIQAENIIRLLQRKKMKWDLYLITHFSNLGMRMIMKEERCTYVQEIIRDEP